MQPVRAVLFDLDGTLLDGSGFGETIEHTCMRLADACPGVTPERLLRTNSAVWNAYWPEVGDRWALGVLDNTTAASKPGAGHSTPAASKTKRSQSLPSKRTPSSRARRIGCSATFTRPSSHSASASRSR